MAIPSFWRIDEFVKAANGPALAGAEVFFANQPANTKTYPPTPLTQLYADPFGVTPITQPLIADGFGHVSAYVAAGTYTEVVAINNINQLVYPDQSYGLSSAQILLETNNVPNPNQGVLNIVGAGDINVTLNGVGQTVIESTGVVLPGTGNGPLLVTAFSGVTTAPNGDILTADGLGNAKDSGTLISGLAPANGVLIATTFPGADIGAQVNAAIAQLGVAGGSIYIPSGSYSFSNTIYIPRVIRLFGASGYGTQLRWTSSTGWAIVVADQFGTSIYPEGSISDLSLVGPTSTDTVGAIYIGGSDAAASTGAGFPASPLIANDPAASFGDHFNFNRLNISQFGIGVQWGNNGWSNTFLECALTSNATNVYFPNSTSDSGERIAFVGSSIQNATTGLLMAAGGTQVDVDFFFTACSFDFCSGWEINNLNSVWEVNLVNCHIESQQQWLQNYGYCNLVACNFTQGTNSGVLGYLINNQSPDGFTVHGGTFFNGGSGTVMNTASQPSVWIGALINGTGGSLVGVTGAIDSTGNARFLTATIAGTISSYNGFPTAGNGVASELAAGLFPNQLANFNGGTGISIANTSSPRGLRISFSQSIQRAATSSSTMPSLTLTYTDAAGVARTKILVAADSTNVTTAEHDGVAVITSNGSTVTMTSAGYASSGATQMEWTLAYASELL